MKNKFIFLTIFSLVSFLRVPLLFAVQDAVITVEESAIFSRPTRDSEIGETLHIGDLVKISDYQKDGWFKIRTPSSFIGWIWHSDVSLDPTLADIKGNSLDLASSHKKRVPHVYPWLYLRALATSYSYTSTHIGGYATQFTISQGLSLDVFFRFDDTFRLGLRGGYYKTSDVGNTFFTSRIEGYPMQLGMEFELARHANWKIFLITLGGINMSRVIVTSVPKNNPSNISSMSNNYFATISILSKHPFTQRIFGVIETGYFLGPNKSSGLSNPMFLKPAGYPVSVSKRFSGPLISLGLEFGI